MCGRFSIIIPISELLEFFKTTVFPIYPTEYLEPRYNIAPTQMIPTIVNNIGRELDLKRWGLIPHWAKDINIGSKMINARAETVDEKPSFKHLLKRKRCIIPADGFYEWKHEGKIKRPYRITLKTEEPFSFAGLWDSWQLPDGKEISSCTIITTTPNELMADIHDRMPVILPTEAENLWLDNGIEDSHFLKSLLIPFDTSLMRVYEISSIVNSPKNNTAEVIRPL